MRLVMGRIVLPTNRESQNEIDSSTDSTINLHERERCTMQNNNKRGLDRVYVIEIDYFEGLENEMMGISYLPKKAWQPVSAKDDASVDLIALHTWLDTVRAKVKSNGLRRIISTRAFQKAKAARLAGIPVNEIKKDLLAGWTRDELSKVGA